MIHLVPTKGSRVRDPESKQVIGEEGLKVLELTPFLYRRVQDGELEVKEEQSEESAKDAPKEKGKK